MIEYNRNQIKSFILEFLKEKTYFTIKSITEAFLISRGIKEKTLIDANKRRISMQISPLIQELFSNNFIEKYNSKTYKRRISAELVKLIKFKVNLEELKLPELIKHYKKNRETMNSLLEELKLLQQ